MTKNKLEQVTLEGNEFQQALNEGQVVKAEEGGYLDSTGARVLVVKESCFGFIDKNADGISEEDGFGLDFKISDKSVDRHNDTVDPSGWQLDNFLSNPVVLWNHNSDDVPVGKATNTRLNGDALFSEVIFPSKDLFAFGNTIGRMVRNGFLNAASVGFRPLEAEIAEDRMEDHRGFFAPVDFTKQELLEWSVVPIPANPNALQGAKSMGVDLAPLIEWCEKQLDGEGYLVVPRHEIEAARRSAEDKFQLYVKCQDNGIFELSPVASKRDETPANEPEAVTVEEAPEEPAKEAPEVGMDNAKAVDNNAENVYKSDSLSAEDFISELVKAKKAIRDELAPLLETIRSLEK